MGDFASDNFDGFGLQDFTQPTNNHFSKIRAVRPSKPVISAPGLRPPRPSAFAGPRPMNYGGLPMGIRPVSSPYRPPPYAAIPRMMPPPRVFLQQHQRQVRPSPPSNDSIIQSHSAFSGTKKPGPNVDNTLQSHANTPKPTAAVPTNFIPPPPPKMAKFGNRYHPRPAPPRFERNEKEFKMPDNAPENFKVMVEKCFCKLCDACVNSIAMAEMHYNGKNHQRKLRSEGLPTGEYFSGIMTISAQFIAPLKESLKPKLEEGEVLEEKKPDASEATGGVKGIPELPDGLDDLYCRLCDVTFTNKAQAHQHYSGKKHRANSLNKYKVNNMTTEIKKFHCELCDVYTNAQESLDMHYKGAKHRLNVRMEEVRKQTGGTMQPAGYHRGRVRERERDRGGRWTHDRGVKHKYSKHLYATFDRESKSSSSRSHHRSRSPANEHSAKSNKSDSLQPDAEPERRKSNQYFCSICNCSATSLADFRKHIESMDHKSKVQSKKEIGSALSSLRSIC